MSLSRFQIPFRKLWVVGLSGAVVAAGVMHRFWRPVLDSWVDRTVASLRDSPADGGHDHAQDAEADPGHAHPADSSLDLSPQAMRNLGLSPEYLQPVKRSTFRRSITVPALIVERPGRTLLNVATPMTGVVTHVHAVRGESVTADQMLFQIRLTHEDLVQAQVDFLRTLGELDVELKEIARLRELTKTGAVAGKLLLERQYAEEKLQAHLDAEREALRLHGLSSRQVEKMAQSRRLLSALTIVAPSPDDHQGHEEFRLTGSDVEPVALLADDAQRPRQQELDAPLVIKDLHVQKGQSVQAGTSLCVLADYGELFIEGQAFEQDAAVVLAAAEEGWAVTALLKGSDQTQVIPDLEVQFIDNEIDSLSRTLHVYVKLPNEVIRDEINDDGQRFVTWRYRPGQRLELQIPVEEWEDQFVLPVDAVAVEGAESYVFIRQHGHFDRVPVYVVYRDQRSAVVSSKGRLRDGQIVAMRSAHRMQMELKKQSSGGVDAHAGHTH